jgi:DNA-binding response OmpR family regulator
MLTLIAERDPVISRLLCRLCEMENWQTVVMAGSQALAYCSLRLRPELIIIDASLSGPPDGVCAASLIRASWPMAPIILTTDCPTQAAFLRDQGLCFLEKPFALAQARSLMAQRSIFLP